MKQFKCTRCGLFYQEESWAKKCSKWCKAHKELNIEIVKHAFQ